ncbi:helix-turn-helix domain-containing protein [Gordonia sp. (in: high G+C Gram-positive bacteria)]|jgi:excisionase family DNA binding protein|uniref:helix-turn-helix domain-containing protein n=1 Tax=Gordonia sp. (in: high G+C Gram-positive bacteria) TaxID=84139 RepID=UPI001D296923|nr:helix-turn-helix domain-containing protein [Gordonia sp. (in: high G+C Gram-positive bacteria)]MCB1296712.1 helix-turn-helix domain-containing protein [Gordonia sp. (in: high G+C Gram-positive bacteria)]HMS75236.1 helix-turn-helix domain-containing protein [Gordonia sp. (in: high G+C Gram-positive bacteria)]HQV16785.1 helix-turn-helix domain-containing protein [Gordonia sp. (in: high G+C Gram-positive bacteria)]
MSHSLTEDVEALRLELAGDQPEIEVTLRLPRESAKKVLALLDAEQTTGALVIPAKHEFTTTEAAKLLGMSRPTLMRMIERKRIEFRMVGKHHRIPASSIQKMREFLDEDHMAVVADLANKYGNLD